MPSDRFEVDLTSVCVRRGAVQLPFRLKDAFSEGPVAAVDADSGSILELGFQAPRELSGLGSFFEAHALRANDRIGLVFMDEGLQVQAIRRERSSARRQPDGEAAATGRSGRGRPAPPAKGSPGGTREASGPASSPSAGDDSAPRSAASQTPPSLRLEVPRTSEPAPQAGPTGRPPAPRWQPLDVTAENGRDEENDAAPGATSEPANGGSARQGAGSVTVREVRRAGSRPPSTQPQEDPPDVKPRAARPGADSEPVPPTRREPREEAADAEGSGSGFLGLGRRLGLGRGSGRVAGRREGRAGGATPDRAGLHAGIQDEADAATPGRPGVRVGDQQEAANHEARVVGRGPGGELSAEPSSDANEAEADSVATRASRASRVETATAIDESAAEPDTVGRDIGAVRSYLAGPDVPAIVRTERVAEALGVSVGRAERALDRVSEESERLSRIRGGAYMLRRPSKE